MNSGNCEIEQRGLSTTKRNHYADRTFNFQMGSRRTILSKEHLARDTQSAHLDAGGRLMSGTRTRDSVILGVRRQDPERWEQFTSIYRPILAAYLRNRGVRGAEIEELTQDIYCKLVSKIHTYDPKRYRFRAWLYRVANNALIDSIRRRTSYEKALKGWERHMLQELKTRNRELEGEWVKIHREKILKHAIRAVRAKVQPPVWSCFVGRLLNDRPAQEIARELGMKDPNAVYVNAGRVLKKVREFCNEFGEDISDGFESELS